MRLIQRCEFKTRNEDEITGIDSLLRYEYMGAAEYEFGTLPGSLRRIVANLSAYRIMPTPHKSKDGRDVMLFAASFDALDSLADVATGKVRCKCCSYMPEVLAGKEPRYYRTQAWWDVQNDWIAVIGTEDAVLVKRALEAVSMRWASKTA